MKALTERKDAKRIIEMVTSNKDIKVSEIADKLGRWYNPVNGLYKQLKEAGLFNENKVIIEYNISDKYNLIKF